VAMLKVSCPHCGTPTRIDSARLPDHPLRLPCPSCQGELVLDKAKLTGGQSPSPGADAPTRRPEGDPVRSVPPPSFVGAAPPVEAAGLPPLSASPPATPAAPLRPKAATPAADPVRLPGLEGPGAGGSGASVLPADFAISAGTRLPPGIMVGEDVAAMAALRDALQPLGASLEVLAGPEVVRRLESVPALQLIVVGQAGPPPCAAVAPFVDLPIRARRLTFVVLVASDVETLDGNLAFLHGVDLVLNKRDVGRAAEPIVAALEYRKRLYAPLLEAEEVGSKG